MISQKRADAPKMIFLGRGSIGKREYEFWKEIIGYEIISGEGKCFRTTWSEMCELLDQEVPTILFDLGVPGWEDAAYWFESSGQIIQTIVGGFLEDVRNMSFGDSENIFLFSRN